MTETWKEKGVNGRGIASSFDQKSDRMDGKNCDNGGDMGRFVHVLLILDWKVTDRSRGSLRRTRVLPLGTRCVALCVVK